MARGPKKPSAKGSRRGSGSAKAQRLPPTSASVARWSTADDIPEDDEDTFHRERDKILLDQDGMEMDDGDDVFGGGQREVLGMPDSSSDEDDGDGDASLREGESDGEEIGSEDGDALDAPSGPASAPASKRTTRAPASSDEEDEDSEESESEEGGWGTNKRAYYNTNDLSDLDSDIDEEEARAMELKEVRRLQSKSRQSMEDDDFGLANGDDLQGDENGGADGNERERRRRELDQDGESEGAQSTAPQAFPSDPIGRAALLAQVQKTSPETIALAGEYADIVDEYARIDAGLRKANAEMPNHPSLALMHLHHQTLMTYLTTLTFFFHLRAQPEYARHPSRLSEHPVLARLVKLKQGLAAMDDLGLAVEVHDGSSQRDDTELSGSDDDIDIDADREALIAADLSDGSEALGELDDGELAELLADEKENFAASAEKTGNGSSASPLAAVPSKQKANGKGKAKAVEPLQPHKGAEKNKKSRKRKAGEDTAPPSVLAGLARLEDGPAPDFASSSRKKSKQPASTFADDEAAEAYGEPTALSASDSADKNARRKSLKFYTGQISSREARRGAAARDRMGGDADIPYRDRERSRTAVTAAAANRAAKASGTDASSMALDGGDWGEADDRDWRDVMGVEKDGHETGGAQDGIEDDYYDLVAGSKRAAKKAKKAEYDEMREAERVVDDASLMPGEHRGINRAIEKNRGLTPHRPKSVRNPRVKKKLRYDKANKKLASMRPVFKGGQAALQGGYGGEASGISVNTVKSTKFGK